MVKFLVQRPVGVFMTTIASLLLGMVAMNKIPISLMPQMDIPAITVQVNYPNSTAREIETNIVRALRNQLVQVNRLKDIQSNSRDGLAVLKLYFEYGTNIDYAFIETNEKIDASLNYLPKNMERPKVIKASVSDIPLVNLVLRLKEDYSDEKFLEISRFSELVLKKRIEQLPDIAIADLSGQSSQEIIVKPKLEVLRSMGMTQDIISNAIIENNFELSNLRVQNGIYEYNFKFSTPLGSVRDIEDIYINIHNRLFKLRDLATVELVSQKERGLVYFNGDRALVLSIIKQSGARVFNLKKALDDFINQFKEDYPEIEFSIVQDQTKLLKLSISNLKSSLVVGSMLAILIMFFFLKDFKSPVIIGISIPISLLISLFLMFAFGMSINIISLSGLILGVGMMIDNAIIVIDNITQKLDAKVSLLEACISGTNEIITPLISSILTTCSVFFPLLFLGGIAGTLFYDQALAVSIGLVSSLLVSILFIPVVYYQLMKRSFRIESLFSFKSKRSFLEKSYEKGYDFFVGRPIILYGIAFSSILLAVVLFNVMSYSQLPKLNEKQRLLVIDWNENIHVRENQSRVEKVFENINKVDVRFSLIGEQQFLLEDAAVKTFSESEVFFETSNLKEIAGVVENLQKNISDLYPEATFSIQSPKTVFQEIFGSDISDFSIEVYSRDGLEVPSEDEAVKITNKLQPYNPSKIALKETIAIQLVQENIILYKVDQNDLINELKSAFKENMIDNLKTVERFIPIKLYSDEKNIYETINSLFVINETGVFIPIKSLIRIKKKLLYKNIFGNKSREYLKYDLGSVDDPSTVTDEIKSNFGKDTNYLIDSVGQWIEIENLKKQMGLILIISILLLYFIMAAQFESLWQPLIVLAEIPIDIGGALVLLWIFGETINLMAAIGIIVMSGIIINDSILKIHTINLLRKEGYNLEEAIKEGGNRRLKPILMTSLTTILALLPFLFIDGMGADLQKPMALTVIGGMLLGTLISLYFIPLLYKKIG